MTSMFEVEAAAWHFEACNSFFSLFEEDAPAWFSLPLALTQALGVPLLYKQFLVFLSSISITQLFCHQFDWVVVMTFEFQKILCILTSKKTLRKDNYICLHPFFMILHAAHAIMSVSEAQEDKYKVISVNFLIKIENLYIVYGNLCSIIFH